MSDSAPTEDLVLRPAAERDIDGAVALFTDVASEGRWIGTEAGFDRVARAVQLRELATGQRPGWLLLAETAERIVGLLTLAVARYGVADLGMMVDAAWRGRGVGEALLRAGIDWAADHPGVHKISLQHWPHNHAAHRLYRKLGFSVEGRLHRHYRRANGEVWDAIVMGLVVDERVRPSSVPDDGAPEVPDHWRSGPPPG